MTLVHSPSAHTHPGSADSNPNPQPAWTVRREQTGSGVSLAVVDRKSGGVIALVKNGGGSKEANAHILAAAPDMYAALYEMFCEGPIDVAFAGNPVAIKALEARIHAAIGKATAPASSRSVGTKASAEVNQTNQVIP